MSHHSDIEDEVDTTENQQQIETIALIERLTKENKALSNELNIKTARLRALQWAVHSVLMGLDKHSKSPFSEQQDQTGSRND